MQKIQIALAGLLVTATVVSATPVQWSASAGGNGHYYDYVASPLITWSQALSAAGSSSYLGLPGHLTTSTSQAENNFLQAAFSDPNTGGTVHGYLGGYQDTTAPDYAEPAGGWRWITGETWSYTAWWTFENQPDNYQGYGGHQDYLHADGFFKWNDVEASTSNYGFGAIMGYYVEYESSAVPEPSLSALAGLVGVSVLRRVRR